MSNLPKLDRVLKGQVFSGISSDIQELLQYAENIVKFENVIAVVSDIRKGTSRIYPGKFGRILGIDDYKVEDSIWEKGILDLMTEKEREFKYLAELRFYSYLRHMPRKAYSDYYLISKLDMTTASGDRINVIHRMFYIYSAESDAVTHALCLYGLSPFDFAGKCLVVNSLTGVSEELTPDRDITILSKRELQVLKLIEAGKKSIEIASILSISKNTVSRHRQEILAKLQVKNSVEACRLAKTMKII